MEKQAKKQELKVCELCGKVQERKANGRLKNFHRHHIDYKLDLTIMLCYTCHSLVHGRLRFGNPWDKKYGKDKGCYEFSKAYIKAVQLQTAKLK